MSEVKATVSENTNTGTAQPNVGRSSDSGRNRDGFRC